MFCQNTILLIYICGEHVFDNSEEQLKKNVDHSKNANFFDRCCNTKNAITLTTIAHKNGQL